MNCRIVKEFFDVTRLLQEELKNPRDYGSGQVLYHSEATFLDEVYLHPGTKVSELSTNLGITNGAATQTATKLIDKGLIEAYRQAGNKKEKFYRLTRLGEMARQGHEQHHKEANRRLCEYFCSLSENEAANILGFLEYLKECIPFSEFTCKSSCTENERMSGKK